MHRLIFVSQETLALSREDKPESARSTLQEESHQQKRKGYIALYKKMRNGPLSVDDIPKASPKARNNTKVATKAARPGVSCLYYFEEMDVLISGYEDSRICKSIHADMIQASGDIMKKQKASHWTMPKNLINKIPMVNRAIKSLIESLECH